MPLIVVCAATLAGLALGEMRPMASAPLVLAASLLALGAALSWQRPGWRILAIAACAAALGAVRASSVQPPIRAPVSPGAQAPFGWLAELRHAAEAGIHAYLPEPQASLAAGVLLGGYGRLDPSSRSDLQRSGLAHLVAIDGFKQVVVAATVAALVSLLLGSRAAALTTVLAVAGYTLITGAHPSAVRAGLMVGLASLGALCGRVADPLTSLLLAVLLMAAVDPPILADLGLQLSLSATLGIVLLWPRLRRYLRRLPRWVAEPIGLTLAVTLATLPVVLTAFRQVSLVSPLAHVLAVPLLAPVLLSSALLAVLAAVAPPFGTACAWLAWLPTTLLAGVIHAFGSLPAAALSTGHIPTQIAVGLAAAMLVWGVLGLPELRSWRAHFRGWRSRHSKLVAPAAYISACLLILGVLTLLRPDGQLRVEPLAVGRGEATFVREPTGRTMLVVRGRADRVALAAQVTEHLALWEHKLDRVVVLDADAERAVGLTLARYPADELVRGEPTSGPTTSAATPGSAN